MKTYEQWMKEQAQPIKPYEYFQRLLWNAALIEGQTTIKEKAQKICRDYTGEVCADVSWRIRQEIDQLEITFDE